MGTISAGQPDPDAADHPRPADAGPVAAGPSAVQTRYHREAVLHWLQAADLVLEGRIAWSSNATFLCRLRPVSGEEASGGELSLRAVYKPQSGERPLWDFPEGSLCLRERAAYLVDEALGWELVPPTVLREGPYGYGAVQAFIPHDPEVHLLAAKGWDRRALRRLAAFDALVNNADRKGGHVLADEAGRLWAIDHGICFHAEDKLRTVLWDWAGRLLPAHIRADLRALQRRLVRPEDPLSSALEALLSPAERAALQRRARELVQGGRYPLPVPGRYALPWPPV